MDQYGLVEPTKLGKNVTRTCILRSRMDTISDVSELPLVFEMYGFIYIVV